jgi:hypothetical protein
MAAKSANRSLTSKAITYETLGGYKVIEFKERMVRAPPDAGTLGVIFGGQNSRRTVCLCTGAGHRCHDQAVGQGVASDADG